MPEIDPPIDATFEGDCARRMRSYYRAHRDEIRTLVRNHKRLMQGGGR